MKVCVLGLWHLGPVTAACLASLGHDVAAYDSEPSVVRGLSDGILPVDEPGLSELVRQESSANRLRFTTDLEAAIGAAEVVWVAYDTPVDDEDCADVEFVLSAVDRAFPFLQSGTLVVISSQLPVGSTRELENRWERVSNGRTVDFVYSPENLRLGQAIKVFLSPDRIVIGRRGESRQRDERIGRLFGRLSDKIIWTRVESAEMTKHALNAFLATSVAFINEIARLCESTGADAAEVERALKSEERIGPKAYLAAGASFSGGTLARDVQFLRATASVERLPVPVLDGVEESNAGHRHWPVDRVERALGSLANRRVAVWGLTYKPGTNALRRSDAVEICRDLVAKGAEVVAHDPSFTAKPSELPTEAAYEADAIRAIKASDALILATAWPQFRTFTADQVFTAMKRAVVVDANRFLRATFEADSRFSYFSVGRGLSSAIR